MELFDWRFRLTRPPAKQLMELRARHRQTLAVVEVAHIQPERAIVFDIQQMITDQIDVFRLTVGRQAHQFVFARVDLESTEVRKGRVEQSQRVRKVQLVRKLDLVPVTGAKTSGGLLAYAIKRENRRLFEG